VAESAAPSLFRLTTDADSALRAGDYETAARLYVAALDRANVHGYQRAAILSNLGLAWQALNQLDKATRSFEEAVAADPNVVSAQMGLGNMHALAGRHSQALEHYDRALRIDPRSAIAHANRALSLEAVGRIDDAWAEAEWRYSIPTASSYYPYRYAKPRWRGEALHGKTLLVHREQGLGDIIQYLRFLPLLARLGGHVRLECPKPLVPLVPAVAGLEVIRAENHPVPDDLFDCHVPMLSLPHLLAFRAEDLPATCPYVTTLRRDRDASLPRSRAQPKIGFVWSGSAFDPARNARSTDFLPLLELNATLVSLQKELDEGERSELQRNGIESEGERFRDFGDTREGIAAVDAVVSVDTAVAHLAGAMAKRTWLVLNEPAAVRWGLNRRDTPWYPTMRIFRRQRGESWQDLIARVAREIERECSAGPSP
jgi:hypothetical protein